MACRICVTSFMKCHYSPWRTEQQDPADAPSCSVADRMRVASFIGSPRHAADSRSSPVHSAVSVRFRLETAGDVIALIENQVQSVLDKALEAVLKARKNGDADVPQPCAGAHCPLGPGCYPNGNRKSAACVCKNSAAAGRGFGEIPGLRKTPKKRSPSFLEDCHKALFENDFRCRSRDDLKIGSFQHFFNA